MLFQNASFFQKFPDPFPVAGLQSLFVLTDMLQERVDLLKKIFLIQKEQIAPGIFVQTGYPGHIQKAARAETSFFSEGWAFDI